MSGRIVVQGKDGEKITVNLSRKAHDKIQFMCSVGDKAGAEKYILSLVNSASGHDLPKLKSKME